MAILDAWSRDRPDERWPWYTRGLALDLFDDEAAHQLEVRSVQLLRERGALAVLPMALGSLATLHMLEGRLAAAATALDEADAINESVGQNRLDSARALLAGYAGDEVQCLSLAEVAEAQAITRGRGQVMTICEHARSILYNGLGNYEPALLAARSASSHEIDASTRVLPELIEAAARSGSIDMARSALQRLTERTRAAGTDWALGVEARSRALLAADGAAEEQYGEAIARLGSCRVASELARAHLLYGEWLRRQRRRRDAREQLRTAHDMLEAMGMAAFAERASREMQAAGEQARPRGPGAAEVLTPQEAQIARMVAAHLTNREIAARSFISASTVEYHLRKIFRKLGVTSRTQLTQTLGDPERTPHPGTSLVIPSNDLYGCLQD
jgi:DNA-binding CsgD family transcriptional regulator